MQNYLILRPYSRRVVQEIPVFFSDKIKNKFHKTRTENISTSNCKLTLIQQQLIEEKETLSFNPFFFPSLHRR